MSVYDTISELEKRLRKYEKDYGKDHAITSDIRSQLETVRLEHEAAELVIKTQIAIERAAEAARRFGGVGQVAVRLEMAASIVATLRSYVKTH